MYSGNLRDVDLDQQAANFISQYSGCLPPRAPEVPLPPLSAQRFMAILQSSPTSVPGLDSWHVSELRFVSHAAAHHLASMFTLIEQGAARPAQMTRANAVYFAKEGRTRGIP